LLEGIHNYIERKQSAGLFFDVGARNLFAFSKYVGDVPLEVINQRHILTFLDGPQSSAITWHSKYSILKHFFSFWIARRELSGLPMPPKRAPAPPQTFVPYIYTRTELRRMLSATRSCQRKSACKIDWKTLRAFLVFLYGTGALVGEALRLLADDVDFKRRMVTIRGRRYERFRTIPIGPDLYQVLKTYHDARRRMKKVSPEFFLNKYGEPFNVNTLAVTFQRLRRTAGISRTDGGPYQPRLHDLRHTFAVHRLTAWYKHGADLNRMVPALSAYIGQVGLASAERYLRLTPERFRAQLNTLSPKRGRKHWRDDPALMRFLAEL
jgi:integrase/recombinase XerD